jgi:hypothetical protein
MGDSKGNKNNQTIHRSIKRLTSISLFSRAHKRRQNNAIVTQQI